MTTTIPKAIKKYNTQIADNWIVSNVVIKTTERIKFISVANPNDKATRAVALSDQFTYVFIVRRVYNGKKVAPRRMQPH
jgi:hypothetical protein